MLDPSMVVFNLTDQCDNACLFCICRKQIREKIGTSEREIAEKLASLTENSLVDIYGGEPTLNASFMEIVRQAKQKHCFINIASNARNFAREDFFETFRAETEDYQEKIFIRSSLHGHTAEIHDAHTRRPNSFDEAIAGIEQLKQAGYRMSVNTVVSGGNYQHLGEIHRLIEQYDVDIFKISFMRFTWRNRHIGVKLSDLKAELPKVLDQVAKSKTTLDLDSIPYCVVPEHLALYAKEENRKIENEKRLVKDEKCDTCAVVALCPGVDREYFELFGGVELEPISEAQASVASLFENRR